MADWGESTSKASRNEGGGTGAASGDATWLHRFFDTERWSTPGGDYSATISASTSVANAGDYTWESTSQLVDDVQSWLDDPSTNAGWILVGDESQNQTTKRFDSRENAIAANRPVLTIVFVLP